MKETVDYNERAAYIALLRKRGFTIPHQHEYMLQGMTPGCRRKSPGAAHVLAQLHPQRCFTNPTIILTEKQIQALDKAIEAGSLPGEPGWLTENGPLKPFDPKHLEPPAYIVAMIDAAYAVRLAQQA